MVRPSTDSAEKGEKKGGEVRMGRSLLHLQDQAFLKCEVGSDLEQQRGENFLTNSTAVHQRGKNRRRERGNGEENQGRNGNEPWPREGPQKTARTKRGVNQEKGEEKESKKSEPGRGTKRCACLSQSQS